MWGGPPGPRPTPPSACLGLAGSGSRGTRADRGVRPTLLFLAAAGILIPAETSYQGPVFTDVTAQAGIRFVHNSGRTGKKYLPETMGSGGVA